MVYSHNGHMQPHGWLPFLKVYTRTTNTGKKDSTLA